jgi:tetratricopeptide (TPR) repeat protein
VVGIEVFDRGADFDPRQDPIVRIDARRLRSRLAEYYDGEGRNDAILISFEPGSYVPRFSRRTSRTEPSQTSNSRPRHQPMRTLLVLPLLRRARRNMDRLTGEGIQKALTLFEQAATAQPALAIAHLGVATASLWLGLWNFEPAAVAFARSRAAAGRALEQDPVLAEARAVLAVLQALYDLDFQAANRGFLTALRLSPASPMVRQARAMSYLAPLGLFAEATSELRDLAVKGSRDARYPHNLAWLHFLQRDYRTAEAQLCQALKLNSRLAPARLLLGLTLERLGQDERAAETLLSGDLHTSYPLVALRLEASKAARAGRQQDARNIAGRMERQYTPGMTDPILIMEAFLAGGDSERAFQWLDRARQERRPRIVFVNSDPVYDSIRGTARFAEIVAGIGLAPGKNSFD